VGDGRLIELVQLSYATLMNEGIDAWLEKIPTDDFVWDMTAMGLGQRRGMRAMRDFYTEWTGSYEEWFIEPGEIEELSDSVVVNAVRQGGRLLGSEGRVVLDYGQLGLWEGERLKLAANYPSVPEARAEGLAIVVREEATSRRSTGEDE
jgi:hypothetical protein